VGAQIGTMLSLLALKVKDQGQICPLLFDLDSEDTLQHRIVVRPPIFL